MRGIGYTQRERRRHRAHSFSDLPVAAIAGITVLLVTLLFATLYAPWPHTRHPIAAPPPAAPTTGPAIATRPPLVQRPGGEPTAPATLPKPALPSVPQPPAQPAPSAGGDGYQGAATTVTVGGPCDRPGDVSIATGFVPVICRDTPDGPTWRAML